LTIIVMYFGILQFYSDENYLSGIPNFAEIH